METDPLSPKTVRLTIVDESDPEGMLCEFSVPDVPRRGERMMLKIHRGEDPNHTETYDVWEVKRVLWNVLTAPHCTLLSAFVFVSRIKRSKKWK